MTATAHVADLISKSPASNGLFLGDLLTEHQIKTLAAKCVAAIRNVDRETKGS